jgi:hypothetical protein
MQIRHTNLKRKILLDFIEKLPCSDTIEYRLDKRLQKKISRDDSCCIVLLPSYCTV